MIVFKTFFKVLKEYKVSLIMYLSITIAVICILSSVGSGGNTAYSSISQGLVIVDNDRSEVSKGLISYLGNVNTILEGDYTSDQITDMLYYTRISNYLVIPEGFGAAFLEGKTSNLKVESTKNAGARMGYSVETEMESYFRLTSGYLKGGYSFAEADSFARESLANTDDVQIVAENKVADEKVFVVFQYLPYGILTLLLSAIFPVLLRFGSSLLSKRTSISSYPAFKKQAMLALASAATTGIFTVFLIIIASSLSGEAFSERWWLIIIDVAVLAVTVAMTIVALSNFRIKPEAASGITNLVSLSFCFLGGIFVPLEYIGNTAKAIGQFLPTYWYSEAMQRIKNGSGIGDIVNCLLIQLMFGIMILVIGLLVGKHNVKKAE